MIRSLVAALFCVTLAGCWASRQDVTEQLGARYIGQNVDVLVMQFGPPASSFRMNNGGTSHVWNLAATTDVDVDRGYGTIKTRSCKVNVVADPKGTVTQLTTEDASASTGVYGMVGIGGTICSQRLGIKKEA